MVLCCIYIAINQHVIAEIDNWLCMMFQNHDSYVMETVCATQQLCDKICDILHCDNFVVKTDVNLIKKTTNLATHG